MPQLLMSAIELSRGSTWEPNPGQPPYLVPQVGEQWQDGADAYVVFTDSSGGVLARIDADHVTPDGIYFIATSDQVDLIPNGANFEIFVAGDNGDQKIRYGIVVRREVEFFDSPARQENSVALQFQDTFPTLGLRTDWIKFGSPIVGGNPSLPNSVGPVPILLPGDALAAIRWSQELNSDTVRMKVRLIDHAHNLPLLWFSYTNIIVTSDVRFTTGLMAQFIHSAAEGQTLRLGMLNGDPWNTTYTTAPINLVVADNEDFTVYYDASVDTLSVFRGSDSTPLVSWTDDLHTVPHGRGYRGFGASFKCSQDNAGIQLSYIAAKDDV